MIEQVLRNEQVDNKHIFHWFMDGANHSAFRHFPELMRLKSGAAARVEHSTNIGEGLTIRLDTQDTSKETPLVANVLAKAALFLTGLQAGHTFIIDDNR